MERSQKEQKGFTAGTSTQWDCLLTLNLVRRGCANSFLFPAMRLSDWHHISTFIETSYQTFYKDLWPVTIRALLEVMTYWLWTVLSASIEPLVPMSQSCAHMLLI